MGAAFVAERAKGGGSSGAGTTVQFSISGVTVGNKLILHIGVSPPGVSSLAVTSITDDKGNTWQVDVSANATATGSARGMAVCSSDVATVGGGGALTLTIHLSASGSVAYKCEEVSGLGAFDVGAAGQHASSTSVSTGNITPAGAGEFITAAFSPGTSEASFTPGSGYTQAGTPRNASPDICVEYDLAAGSGLQNATGTLASAGVAGYSYGIAAYLVPVPTDAGQNAQTVTQSAAKEARSDAGSSSDVVVQAKVKEALGEAPRNAQTVVQQTAAGGEQIVDSGRPALAILRGTAFSIEFVADQGRSTEAVVQRLAEARRDTGKSSGAVVQAKVFEAIVARAPATNLFAIIAPLQPVGDSGLNTLVLVAGKVNEAPSEVGANTELLIVGSPFSLPPWIDFGLNTLLMGPPILEVRPIPPAAPVLPFLHTHGLILIEDRPDFTPPTPEDILAGQCALWYDGLNGVIQVIARTFDNQVVRYSILLAP